ncbi:hypothetical protein [Fibrivirga algicola]|uniref:Uncharacterized protein n=1 Tax=Fibrivirga algicola TaxID=2950420 RepID=A0ABX0QGW8_9BACT|nr:hypothetical protein [Fibrivirga algicola]NID09344.1 hypothetical protein [Fibrivirga algicola]
MPHTESINTLAHDLSMLTGPAVIGDQATVQELAVLECTYVYLLTKWTYVANSWQVASNDIAASIEQVYRLMSGSLAEFLDTFSEYVCQANLLSIDFATN